MLQQRAAIKTDPTLFWNLVDLQRKWDQCWTDRLHKLRLYYFQISDLRDYYQPLTGSEVIPIDSSEDEENVGCLQFCACSVRGLRVLYSYSQDKFSSFFFAEPDFMDS